MSRRDAGPDLLAELRERDLDDWGNFFLWSMRSSVAWRTTISRVSVPVTLSKPPRWSMRSICD